MSGVGFKKPQAQPAPSADVQQRLAAAANMQPSPLASDPRTEQLAQEAITRQPETIRQHTVQRSTKQQPKSPVVGIHMRMAPAEQFRFVELSKRLRMSYAETAAWLMNEAGIDSEGDLPKK